MSQVSAALWLLHGAIFTTGLENSISRASSWPLTLAASGKSFPLPVSSLFATSHIISNHKMCTMNTGSQGGDMHQYTKTHLQFLAPCSPLQSPIRTESNTQAIYPWRCNFSPLPCWFGWKQRVALQQRELKGTEFEMFQSLSNSIHSDNCSVFKKGAHWKKLIITGYTEMSCK